MDRLMQARKTVGIKQTLKAIQENSTKLVFLANDADKKIINEVTEMCKEKNIKVETIESMKQLGKVCGIDVSASVASILDNRD
ncbi:MAG: ribosomal L7Ae/L30e/S12e/Gadd45 family protein [Eubacteriales bacterium]|nr:ribosomal L7Ae/L30e/S12e/Gadd45 family protein [Eubacteriales bacterium]